MKLKTPPEAGSMSYYLRQMLSDLMKHGEYRVRWEWAIQEAEYFEQLAQKKPKKKSKKK